MEQASCLLSENSATSQFKLTSCTNISNGLEARSTKNKLDCGTGILPVLKNGATSQFKLTSCTNISNGLEARSTRKSTVCGTGILPVLKKSAKYWFELID
ncbi:hypothetical protein QUB19_03090 [Microcoleus sp. B4-C5]|uniref:hypothetical protein n=1 Tax=unclassified Microcoleus TaxID=2642155 RepID=UPI002FD43356